MIFNPTRIDGAWLIDIEPLRDERGFFARVWCHREFSRHGLDPTIVQESISHNLRAGTIRGLHFQKPPYDEIKIVSCIRGALFDVIVDLRPNSPTYRAWQGFELTAENWRSLYIPKGCAHGFQTLADDTAISYRISAFHVPEAADGYRYDDPAFGIVWPLPVSVISERDLGWRQFVLAPDITDS